ncbi:surface protein (macronuclear) [Tetrahymena thermophila SB210]|uniref:Surface protein n=1 Tax=Tetrahymena thermophila (strain SB210) TaxID=312017 RepID=Q234V6_TETTS|nr:surface protein [Tetrahymena thermophila SB210]EAR91897.2 surface protein [Tetrahymena thermophila SB210]|eukprot:XP_001012142.2 surface protein [Tetrahymena thermophila SB210]
MSQMLRSFKQRLYNLHKKLYFNANSGKCALCEEGYFFNQNSCDQCDQTCLTCTGKNKQDCIDCRPGLIFSSVSKTCEESSQVQNEQKQIKQSQEKGCYDQKQQQVVSTCLDQIENSQSNTKILDTLFIVNLSLIAVSSKFAPLGSSLGWIFIQNQQLLERTANSIVIVQELIYLTAIVFLGVIFSQDIEINPYNISELNSNMRNAYRIAMYVYLGLSIIVLAFILMQKAWNYFKILRKTNDMNKSQTTTGDMNMVEQMTDSNIEKLFEMLNQSKSKNQFHWKNQN